MTPLEAFLSACLLFLSISYYNLIKHNKMISNDMNKLRSSFESFKSGVHNVYTALVFRTFEESDESYRNFVLGKMSELYNYVSR